MLDMVTPSVRLSCHTKKAATRKSVAQMIRMLAQELMGNASDWGPAEEMPDPAALVPAIV